MSIIKSFSVCDDNGEAGDMFYIKHNSSNFTIIDCCLNCEDREMTLYAVTFVLFVNKQTVIIKAFDYAKSLIEVCERI